MNVVPANAMQTNSGRAPKNRKLPLQGAIREICSWRFCRSLAKATGAEGNYCIASSWLAGSYAISPARHITAPSSWTVGRLSISMHLYCNQCCRTRVATPTVCSITKDISTKDVVIWW